MISGANAVIESLKREGIEYIFSLPGTTTLDFFDAVYHDPDINLIVSRHEQGAAFMADGYTRASGKPGVCMASRGPGALNMAIAIQNAYMESIPVISIIGQVGQDISERDAFEEMDLVSAFRPFTKWAVEIQKAERIPELVQRAVRTAVCGRPRPVMISVPMDLQQAEIDPRFSPATNLSRPGANPKELEAAVQLFKDSRRPVILAGGGINLAQAGDELRQFAELLNIPVITTWLRNDVFPNDHPLYLGASGFGAPKVLFEFLNRADLVLAVGCHFSEFTTLRYSSPKADIKIINIDIESEGQNRVFSPALGIVADAKSALASLRLTAESAIDAGEIKRLHVKYAAETEDLKAALKKVSYIESGQYQGAFIHPGEMVQEIQKTLSEDTIIVADSGSFMSWVGRHYRFVQPGTLIAPAGGAMGFGFPAAIGAQLAHPGRTVLAVTGDGGFMMVLQELETVVRYNLPVIVVVMNNFSFANVKEKQLKMYGGRVIGSEYKNPDFAQMARLFGANGERVERSEDIAPAMKRALAAKGPTVIDVMVDPELTLPPVE
jgi:acetolactate synthase-1/2/3 large subunit